MLHFAVLERPNWRNAQSLLAFMGERTFAHAEFPGHSRDAHDRVDPSVKIAHQLPGEALLANGVKKLHGDRLLRECAQDLPEYAPQQSRLEREGKRIAAGDFLTKLLDGLADAG